MKSWKRTILTAILVSFILVSALGVGVGSVASQNTPVESEVIDDIPDAAFSDVSYITDVHITNTHILVAYESRSDGDTNTLVYTKSDGSYYISDTITQLSAYETTIESVSDTEYILKHNEGGYSFYDATTDTRTYASPDSAIRPTSDSDVQDSSVPFRSRSGNTYITVQSNDRPSEAALLEVTSLGSFSHVTDTNGNPVWIPVSDTNTNREVYHGYVDGDTLVYRYDSTFYAYDIASQTLLDTAVAAGSQWRMDSYNTIGNEIRVVSVQIRDDDMAGIQRFDTQTETFTSQTISMTTDEPGSLSTAAFTDSGSVIANIPPSYDSVEEITISDTVQQSISTGDDVFVFEHAGTAHTISTGTGDVQAYAEPTPTNISMSVSDDPIPFNSTDPVTGSVTVTGEVNGEVVTLQPDEYTFTSNDSRIIAAFDSFGQYQASGTFDADDGDTAQLTVSAYGETVTQNVSVAYTEASLLSVTGRVDETVSADSPVSVSVTFNTTGDVPTDFETTYQLGSGTEQVVHSGRVDVGEQPIYVAQWDVPNQTGESVTVTRRTYIEGQSEPSDVFTQQVRVVPDRDAVPDSEIRSVTAENATLSDGSDARVNVSVSNNEPTFRDVTVTLSGPENGTVSETLTAMSPYTSQTTTLVADPQPNTENGSTYTVTTSDDARNVTLAAVVGPPTFRNIGHPSFDTMDRVLAITTDTTVVILFLLTGAAAMLASQTSGVLGSVLFTFLLLPAWVVIGTPLYLFVAALPLVVIFYISNQGGPQQTEIQIRQ